jgi:predicted RNA-binding Zn-ribbon protein involved in translation (DUF1610 family)
MECPYCGNDLLTLAWEYWTGARKERFELICPECGNNVIVVARLSFKIYPHEEITDEI